jgi:hypothetical protein
MVEFIRNPSLVEVRESAPEFSWVVPASVGRQAAYQVEVASSKEVVGQPDLWDSGKEESDQSVNVKYDGKPLSAHAVYFWRVKIWDASGQPSAFSEVQRFETGALSDYASTSNVFTVDDRPPKRVMKKSEGSYFIDFGKDAFGTLVLNINPKSRKRITVCLGEKLAKPQEIDRDPGGSIRYQEVALEVMPGQNSYAIDLPPNERNTNERAVALPDSIGVVMPFRYCELKNVNFEVLPENIFQRVVNYYFDDDQSYFTSSDTVLNQVWEMSRYSMKATSFCGVYVDGDRERIPYEADAFINQLGHYCTDREYSMGRLTNDYFMETPTWPTEWILFTPLLFYYDYLYTGNTEAIGHHWEKLKYKTLTELAREDGLINTSAENQTDELILNLGFDDPSMRIRDIVDWPPAQKDTGWKLATEEGERDGFEFKEINTVVNAFHYESLKLMAQMATAIDRTEDAEFYKARAAKVFNSFNENLFDPERGYYVDGEGSEHASLHANMFALAFALVPDEYKSSVVDFIKSRGMACSVYGSQFLMDGLYLAGEADYALELLTATHDRSWWNMIAVGSTISMEAWDMKYKPNSDLNHAWGAAPANIIPRHLWGIQPTKPGFEEFVIKPQFSGLDKSSIKVPTIRGSIIGDYERHVMKEVFIFEIPGNMGVNFVYDQERFSEAKVNGRTIKQENESIKLKPGSNTVELFF